jgi:hypothetical protein
VELFRFLKQGRYACVVLLMSVGYKRNAVLKFQNLNQMMVRAFCLFMLVLGIFGACPGADSFECASSQCATYRWNNGTCMTISPANSCINGQQVPSGVSCVACSGLTTSNCSSLCVDYYFNSSSSTCTSCAVTYGADCISCTVSVCTSCAFSSHTVLAANALSCISALCTTANCLACYTVSGS